MGRDRAVAVFRDSMVQGTVTFDKVGVRTHPVRVTVDLRGFASRGPYAMHIHEYGDTREGCASMGPHFNPTGAEHGDGADPSARIHAGDLRNNVFPGRDGRVQLTFLDTRVSIPGILGRGMVIHENSDDCGRRGFSGPQGFHLYGQVPKPELRARFARIYGRDAARGLSDKAILRKLNTESLKTGNAGGRMACAVIGLVKG